MRRFFRSLMDKLFTGSAGMSVVLMAGALLIILGPMFYRGATAVVFRGTVEFRKMQFFEPLWRRGDWVSLESEIKQTDKARAGLYRKLRQFSIGIDVSYEIDNARQIYRDMKKQLEVRHDAKEISQSAFRKARKRASDVRDGLISAFESVDPDEARRLLQEVLSQKDDDVFKGTAGESFFPLAEDYLAVLDSGVDIQQRRQKYAEELKAVNDLLYKLLGPAPGRKARADLVQENYGATRLDVAEKYRRQLLYKEVWDKNVQKSEPRLVDRSSFFDGGLDEVFAMLRDDGEFNAMLNPRWTFYWQYFVDDCTQGHEFGGIGPEIYGTLMLALLSMAFAVPIGIMTAAHLVECTRDTLFVRFIRMCINTLAGVPSIVFGLFGFVLFLEWMPEHVSFLGLSTMPNTLAGGMTLAILVLPVMIRASEEAIKSVPRTYKEASLSLGAGGLRTFLLVTLPAAMPGIMTGIILSLSRAAGETAPIIFVAAMASGPSPKSIFEGPTRALSTSSYDMACGDTIAARVPHNQYGMIMTLILLVLILNIAAIIIRSRLSRKLRSA